MGYRRFTKKRLAGSILSSLIKDFFSNISVTVWLIIVNVIAFFVFFIVGNYFSYQLFGVDSDFFFSNYIGLTPNNILQGRTLWTFLTSMFMHGGFAHLFINMFVLFSVGGTMEKIIGRKRFFWFYIISGIFASLTFVILAGLFGRSELGAAIFGSPAIAGVGASGAIFAIAALFVIILPKSKFVIIFLPFFPVPAYILIPGVLILMWVGSVIWFLLNPGATIMIGNSAHFGGFLIGILYGVYLRKKYRRKIDRLNKMIR